MKIFFDTSAFIALFIAQEEHHKKTTNKYTYYRKQRATFFTSHYVLDELVTRLIYDCGKTITEKIMISLMKSIEHGEIQVLDIDETIFKKSLAIVLKFSDHKLSFTDATTFCLYKDLKLQEIFTLDSDFKKIGASTSF
jgi:predicted nucleic acid-binding protein